MPVRIVVLGGINIDLIAVASRIPEPGETVVGDSFLTTPGGKGANQAAAAARLGARAAMVGRVGPDEFGPGLLRSLEDAGVDASAVAIDPRAHSGVAAITVLAEGGQNRIIQVPGANRHVGAEDLDRLDALLDHADVLLLQHEAPMETSAAAARAARRRGVLVILDPAPPARPPAELLALTDWLTPNETEAAFLTDEPVDSVERAVEAARRLRALGPRNVAVKLGARGAAFAAADASGSSPPFAVAAVDSVGAGDAFNAGLAVALAEGRPIQEALRWGCAAGGLACTRPGAIVAMPSRSEVKALLAAA